MVFDSTYLMIVLVALALGLITQGWVNSAFKRYSRVPLSSGQTGAEVARSMLDSYGLNDVHVEQVGGRLTDHYDPRSKVLRLSPAVYGGRTVAAAGVASHEAGHAVQHAKAYTFARIRQAIVPAAQIGSQLSFPLIFIGLIIGVAGVVWLGVVMYAAAVLFQVVTLPVEFDASRRALAALQEGRTGATYPPEQIAGARRVLTAAAMTYLASTLIAMMYLLYFLGLARD